MGGLFSKKKELDVVEILEKEMDTQVCIKQTLNSPGLRLTHDMIYDIVTIPLMDFHMRLSHEELTVIIKEQRPHMQLCDVKDIAMTLSGGKSVKDPNTRT